ncbi:hypothetical protein KW823_27335, partial [Enterobacter quasiroggenkampii]|nr:hypothetical protein [Enterobacter quasiroggenkampii]
SALIVDSSDPQQAAAFDNAHLSPFGVPDQWGLNTSKAAQHGFKFDSIQDWYPQLITSIIGSRS